MPKASRGRRPASNPKRRTPRPPQQRPVSEGANGVLTADAGVVERPVRAVQPTPRAASTILANRRAATAAASRRGFAESVADYRYVVGDLRRIGILSGGLVVLLIILSFVIR